MNKGFARNFVTVSIVHLVAVFTIMLSGAVPSCRPRKPHAVKYMPVRVVTGGPAVSKPAARPAPDPVVSRPTVPEPRKPVRPTPRKPVPTKPPVKKPPKTARPLPRRPAQPPKLSKPQIEEELLNAAGASTPSVVSPVSMPGSDEGEATQEDVYLAMVWQAFYDAWDQPSYTDAGDAVASVTIELALDGAVTDRTLTKSSGNKTLDDSVMRAAASVQRIPGLSRDFIAENSRIIVQFKVEE